MIKILAEPRAKAVSARLRRLYCCRADGYVSLSKWLEAVDDYTHVITPETTDVDLLSKRARAYEALENGFRSCADPPALQRICDRLARMPCRLSSGAGTTACLRH